MARKIAWWSNNGLVGSDRSGVVEVDDDATEEEIEQAVRDDVFNYFEWGFDVDPAPAASGEG